GAVLLPSPFLPTLTGTIAVLAAGDAGAAERILPAVAAGQQRLALAGADLAVADLASTGLARTGLASTGLATTGAGKVTAATGPGGGGRLTGRVRWGVAGAGAGRIRVAAGPGTGPALFAVPAGAPGLTAAPLETLDLTRREARLGFDATPAELASDPGRA